MKFFDLIQSHNSGPACRSCAWFKDDPRLVEEAFVGLKIMSSGYASVRDRDGICGYHQLYLSGRDSCPYFVAKASVFTQDVAQGK